MKWVVAYIGVLHMLAFVFFGIGYTSDARGYIDGIGRFAAGQVSYFPPGYSLFLAPWWLITSSYPGALAVFVQHVCMVLTLVGLRDIVRRVVGEDLATLALFITGSVAPTLFLPQMVLSENVALFGMAGAMWLASRAGANGALRRDVAAGMLAGLAGLARVVPLVAIVVPMFLLYRSMTGTRDAAIRTARMMGAGLGLMALCASWHYANGGGFVIAGGAGLHLYNRVVTEQGLLNAREPATAVFLTRMGNRPLQDVAHWDVLPVLERQGMSYADARSLMGAVAMEGLRSDPTGFLRHSTIQSWKEYAAAPTLEPWPSGTEPIAALESPVPPGVRGGSNAWWSRSESVFRQLWRVLMWLPVLGLLLLPSMRERLVFLALLAVPAGYLFVTAQVEFFLDRYVAAVLPFALMLSTTPLSVLKGLSDRRYRDSRAWSGPGTGRRNTLMSSGT